MGRRKHADSATANEEAPADTDEAPAAKMPRVIFSLPIPERPKRPGKLLVCGTGDMGQLGLGEDKMECKRPVVVPDLPDIVDCCAGGVHSLCLTQTGDVYSFGCNDEGALGRDTSDEGSEFEPQQVNLPGKVVKMSAGDSHSACLLEDGRVFAWGSFRNQHGNMGLTLEGNKREPIHLLPTVKAHDISSGADHLVVLASNGNVYTVGCGDQGQLGRVPLRGAGGESRRGKKELLGPMMIHAKQKRVFSAVWTTTYCTFVKERKSEIIFAFGLNNYNQLGLAKTEGPVSVPTKTDLKDVMAIAGGQHHTLVLTTDNECFAIGRQDYGRLGIADLSEDVTELTTIKTLEDKDIIDISCGESQSFAVSKDGALYSWGMGNNLQLGTGKEEDEIIPVMITTKETDGKKIVKAAGGGQHSLFLVENENNNTIAGKGKKTKTK